MCDRYSRRRVREDGDRDRPALEYGVASAAAGIDHGGVRPDISIFSEVDVPSAGLRGRLGTSRHQDEAGNNHRTLKGLSPTTHNYSRSVSRHSHRWSALKMPAPQRLIGSCRYGHSTLLLDQKTIDDTLFFSLMEVPG